MNFTVNGVSFDANQYNRFILSGFKLFNYGLIATHIVTYSNEQLDGDIIMINKLIKLNNKFKNKLKYLINSNRFFSQDDELLSHYFNIFIYLIFKYNKYVFNFIKKQMNDLQTIINNNLQTITDNKLQQFKDINIYLLDIYCYFLNLHHNNLNYYVLFSQFYNLNGKLLIDFRIK
jgi:hypothetical protein